MRFTTLTLQFTAAGRLSPACLCPGTAAWRTFQQVPEGRFCGWSVRMFLQVHSLCRFQHLPGSRVLRRSSRPQIWGKLGEFWRTFERFPEWFLSVTADSEGLEGGVGGHPPREAGAAEVCSGTVTHPGLFHTGTGQHPPPVIWFVFTLQKRLTNPFWCFPQADERRSHVEVCAEGGVLVQQLARRVAEHRGAALIADYGHDGTKTDTLRVRWLFQSLILQ